MDESVSDEMSAYLYSVGIRLHLMYYLLLQNLMGQSALSTIVLALCVLINLIYDLIGTDGLVKFFIDCFINCF